MSASLLTYCAANPIVSGSLPNICILTGTVSSSRFSNFFVFSSPKNNAFELTISVHTKPGSNFSVIILKGRSVTPAIGANIKLFFNSIFPIFNFFKYIFYSYLLNKPFRL